MHSWNVVLQGTVVWSLTSCCLVPSNFLCLYHAARLLITSLQLVVALLPVGVEGLQTPYHVSWSRCIALSPIQFLFSSKYTVSPLLKSIECLPWGLFPYLLACRGILGYLSSAVLTMCPNHLNCASSIVIMSHNTITFVLLHVTPPCTKYSHLWMPIMIWSKSYARSMYIQSQYDYLFKTAVSLHWRSPSL